MPADTAPLPLKEQFSRGLDAPICLTWELTYACNLACVHCLSSSGRRDPDELTPAEARGIVDDMVDMKVFYVNIGGGEPMLRPDFFDLVVLRRRAPGRREVLHQRDPAHARAGPAAGGARLPRRADQHRRCHRRHQRRRPRRGLLRRRPPRHGQPGRRRLRALQDQRRRHPPERGGARRAGRHRRLLRRPAAPDAPAPLGPRRRHLGRAAPDGGAAAHALPLAARAPRRADGRLLLPPLGPGRAARRPEPVRGRAGRLPHRPGRRRLRLPLRHRPPVPGRQRARPGRLSRRVARVGAVHLAARAAERGGLRVVRLLRRLPGRLHGGQVLHRPAPRRPGPRVRARARRGRAGGAGRAAAVGRSATPRSAGTGRRSRCPRPSASARRPAPEPVELAGATWPQVEATGARTRAGGPAGLARAARAAPAARHRHPHRGGRGRRAGGALRRASPWRPPSPTGPAASTPASPARCSSATRSWPTCSSSWCAPPAAPSPAWCSSTPTAGTRRRWSRRSAAARPRGTTCSCGAP